MGIDIKAGKVYIARNGDVVKIMTETGIFDDGHDMMRPFLGNNGQRYTRDGKIEFGCRTTMEDLETVYTPAHSSHPHQPRNIMSNWTAAALGAVAATAVCTALRYVR